MAGRLLLLLVVLSLSSVMAAAEEGCPDPEAILPCRCAERGDEIQLWCSHSDVSGVLRGLTGASERLTRPVDELVLEGNSLAALPGRTFAPLRALRLMLRDNGLERVAPTWLGGQEDSILELFVTEPRLRSLPEDSLDRLRTLEALTLQAGAMRRPPRLSGLPRLRYVSLQSPALERLQGLAGSLPSLEQLHVLGAPHVTRLEALALGDLPRLRVLNVSDCGVGHVDARALLALPSLEQLLLPRNRLQDAAMVGRAARALPTLAVLTLDDNLFERLVEATFVDMPSLREIRLSGNRIEEVQRGAFHRLPALRVVDLSRNLLRHIHPEAFTQSAAALEELYLEGNLMTRASELRTVLSQLPRLRHLDASDNRIEDLPEGSLRGHGALERLHLDRNGLRRLHRDALSALPALRELRLRNNSLAGVVDAPFWNLPALKGLDLAHNFFPRLDARLLAKLPALRRLDVSANAITDVDPACFLDTPLLEHVNLSSNAIVVLHPVTFRNLDRLFEVDLGWNRLRELPSQLPRALEYLHVARNQLTELPVMELPALRSLDLTANGLQKLSSAATGAMSQLRRLRLGENALLQLEDGAFHGLQRLEDLDLHDNRLEDVSAIRNAARHLKSLDLRGNRLSRLPANMLEGAQLLQTCDLSHNQLAVVDPDALADARDLQTLDVSHNALSGLPEGLTRLPSLERLDASHNRLAALPVTGLQGLRSLQELRLARNQLATLHEGAVAGLPRLTMLDLGHNRIEVLESRALADLPQLRALRLASNRLRSLPPQALQQLPQLRSAELQNNHIAHIADNAISGTPQLLLLNLSFNALSALEKAGLKSLHSLEVLDLSNNQLARVPSGALKGMDWLVELKMDNNQICAIQGSPFNEMPRLRFLSLKNNKMTTFPEPTFQRLRSNFAVLDIAGNPLSCSCGTIWLQSWLKDVSDDGPHCSDGSLLKEMRLSRQECQNARNVESVAPGCEAEFASGNTVLGTSQVLSTWMEVKDSTVSPQIAPSPQESEYFEDEYVEYEYENNDTSTNASTMHTTAKYEQTVPETLNSLPSEATSSSHYTPGDTPTLYAGTRHNKTTAHIQPVKLNQQPVLPNTGGLTFFGIPLPSLSLGGLWGSARKDDPNIGDVRFVGARGKVQMLPPNDPQIHSGGFVPMFPESGGFMPIVNPTLNEGTGEKYQSTFANSKQIINISNDPSDPVNKTKIRSSTNIQRESVTNSQPNGKRYNVVNENIEYEANDANKYSKRVLDTNILPINKIPQIQAKEDNLNETDKWMASYAHSSATAQTSPKTIVEEQREISQDPKIFDMSLTNDTKLSSNAFKDQEQNLTFLNSKLNSEVLITQLDKGGSVNSGKNITQVTELKKEENSWRYHWNVPQTVTTDAGPMARKPTEESLLKDIVGVISEDVIQGNDRNKETPPSSLSAILIPSGQQFEPRMQAGRSTITKVPLPPQAVPGAGPVEDYLRGPEPATNTQTKSFSAPSNNFPIQDSSMDWYFKNYNNTNLEPYIGPGVIRTSNSVANFKITTVFLLPIFYGVQYFL